MTRRERDAATVTNGAVMMMHWYDQGYRDAAVGVDRWREVPPRHSEDGSMYHDGQDDFKAGRPNKVQEAIK